MINSNFSLNYNINLRLVCQEFSKYQDTFKVSFEPDRYSAVKVKFKPAEDMKEITTSIFGTGKIIITGAQTLREIADAYRIINDTINDIPNVRESHCPKDKIVFFDEFTHASVFVAEVFVDVVRKSREELLEDCATERF